MLNWLRKKLYDWLCQEDDGAECDHPVPYTSVGPADPPRIEGPHDMYFSVYRCSNGYVVEGMVFDHRNNMAHRDPTLHRVVLVDADPQRLAETLALIYVKGHMGNAA